MLLCCSVVGVLVITHPRAVQSDRCNPFPTDSQVRFGDRGRGSAPAPASPKSVGVLVCCSAVGLLFCFVAALLCCFLDDLSCCCVVVCCRGVVVSLGGCVVVFPYHCNVASSCCHVVPLSRCRIIVSPCCAVVLFELSCFGCGALFCGAVIVLWTLFSPYRDGYAVTITLN